MSINNYTYILKCSDGSYYTGWTNNLENRIKMHNTGRGSKYTRARLPVVLIYYEKFSTKSEAMSRECQIKKMSRKEKEILIQSKNAENNNQNKVLEKEVVQTLIKKAIEARKNSYAPYSNFHVGASLLTEDNKIFKGCNIENASFTPTNCAERTAIFTAVAEGHREFKAIAIVGGLGNELQENVTPCGVCLQVLSEFCNPDKMYVIVASSVEKYKIYLLKELLPHGFYYNREV